MQVEFFFFDYVKKVFINDFFGEWMLDVLKVCIFLYFGYFDFVFVLDKELKEVVFCFLDEECDLLLYYMGSLRLVVLKKQI